ncbi:MAG: DUF3122 domain-containing protein [Coleofasciculaceae cyanobacterium]
MITRFPQILPRLILLLGLLLIFFLAQFILTTPPAKAVLRQHQDAPGIMRYHSQESLPDELGQTWQVVLFKKVTPGQPILYNLRLVGFPGLVQLTHPQPLEITTAGGQILTAADLFPQEAPAPNVGQYNFTDVLTKLRPDQSLILQVPLKAEQTLSLKIPQNLVTEWQLLVTEIK